MNHKMIIERINTALSQLEGVPAVTHDARKRMVISEEMLIQLMQELDKEEKEKAEVKEHETAEAE